MGVDHHGPLPIGYRWRSSRLFIIASITVALFSETFIFGFIVPILSYMLEVRLGLNPSQTQSLTTALLAIHGIFSLLFAPIIAHFADKTSDKKIPLLISLAGCFVGTVMVALTPSLWALFLGRIIQGLSGSGTWIVGFSTLADATGQDNMGRVMGTAMSFVTSGVISGPMVAGGLLQLVGYWEAWSAPLAVLVLDMLARLVMVDPPKTPPTTSSNDSSVTSNPSNTVAVPGETTALLSTSPNADQSPIADSKEAPGRGFYQIMFRQPRVLASMANTVSLSATFAGFDTCMPLHVRQAFGWGSGPAGMMFLCLQVPPMFLGPLTGWLRDRNGARFPATTGWVLLIPLFLLLGVPGDPRVPWASAENGGKVIYISCLIAIGIALCLVRGSGSLELIAVVKELQDKDPNIFGPRGGTSRVYSMLDIAYGVGMMLGPLICGGLAEAVGYLWMNLILGKFASLLFALTPSKDLTYFITALLCLVNGISAFTFFQSRSPSKSVNVETSDVA